MGGGAGAGDSFVLLGGIELQIINQVGKEK